MFGIGAPELIITVVILAIIFLICRELVCWYWKINKRVALLTEIRDSLRIISQGGIEISNLDKNSTLLESKSTNAEIEVETDSQLQISEINTPAEKTIPEDMLIKLVDKFYKEGEYRKCKICISKLIKEHQQMLVKEWLLLLQNTNPISLDM